MAYRTCSIEALCAPSRPPQADQSVRRHGWRRQILFRSPLALSTLLLQQQAGERARISRSRCCQGQYTLPCRRRLQAGSVFYDDEAAHVYIRFVVVSQSLLDGRFSLSRGAITYCLDLARGSWSSIEFRVKQIIHAVQKRKHLQIN